MQWVRVTSLAIGLAALPTIGTQGMGTLGDRFVHPDSLLFKSADGDRIAHEPLLRQSDLLVEAEVARLTQRPRARLPAETDARPPSSSARP